MKTNNLILTAAIISCVGSTGFATDVTTHDYHTGQYPVAESVKNSIIYGHDTNVTQAQGHLSGILAGGENNTVQLDAHNSATFGNSNNNNSANSMVAGEHNTITNANNSIAGGWQNASHSESTLVFGNGNAIDFHSENSFAAGERAKLQGKNSLAFGEETKVEGDNVYAIGKKAIANAENTLALGNEAQATMNDSVALGNYSVTNTVQGTSSISINGKTYNFAGVTPVGTVSIGNSSKERTIINVAAGRLDANSTDVINGSQLHAVVTEVESNRARINNNLEALNNHEGRIQTVENKVDNNTTDIQQLMQSINTTNIVLTDAINQGKSYTDSEVAKVGAASAALSALHPLEFNKDDKWQFAVGFGNYKNKTATAIGMFYQPNENILLSLGTTLGTKNNMVNGGATFRFGKNSTMNTDKQIATDTKVQNLEQRLAEIEAKYNELLAKVESK